MSAERPERSKKLSRQISRHLKDEDAEGTLEKLAAFLTDHPPGGGIDPGLLSRFSDFFSAIDHSYAEYEHKVKFAMRNVELSSAELNTSSRELERLNAGINAMLDSLEQGLVFFDENGLCAPVYSRAAPELLGGEPAGRHITEVLRLGPVEREDMALWISIVFNRMTAMPFAELKHLAPRQVINKKGRLIELDYRPLYIGGDIMSGVLMIASDKTEEREADAKLDRTRSEAKKIQSIAQRRNEFWRFIGNIRIFIRTMRSEMRRDPTDDEIMRELHTFKGLAYIFDLGVMAGLFHDAETAFRSGGRDALDEEFFTQVEQEIDESLVLATALFGESFVSEGQVRTVEFSKMVAFHKMLNKISPTDRTRGMLLEFFNLEFMALEVSACFSTFRSELMRIAETQGKPAPEVRFVNGNMKIVPNHYSLFFDSLVHLARNIMDHGIESPSHRREKGKPDRGQVVISSATEVTDGQKFYLFRIQEDGRGFDIHNIKARLSERGEPGVAALSDEETIQRIFDPGFSTLREATTLSGRGVGMAAIKAAVELMGGSVQADRADGPGSLFSFRLPARI